MNIYIKFTLINFFWLYCLEKCNVPGPEIGILEVTFSCVWREMSYCFLHSPQKVCARCWMYLYQYIKLGSTPNSQFWGEGMLAFCIRSTANISVKVPSGYCICSWYGVFLPALLGNRIYFLFPRCWSRIWSHVVLLIITLCELYPSSLSPYMRKIHSI